MSKTKDARRTLLIPFERQNIALEAGQNWLFFNATPLEPLGPLDDSPSWSSVLTSIQPFRPQFNALVGAGITAHPSTQSVSTKSIQGYDGALVLAGKSQERNRIAISDALRLSKQGAPIVVAGDKAGGIGGLRKWTTSMVEQAGGTVEALSKHHAVVFWFAALSIADLPEWSLKRIGEDGWWTAPGTFSADGADAGSKLLANHFAPRIKGKIADFGSGWGYLTARLLEACPSVASVDLFEADHDAITAAEVNVTDPRVAFHWTDIATEGPKGPFDTVIMNPPFHDGGHKGRKSEPRIGQTFIEAAARCLPSGGHLMMVANRQLPYEELLKTRFKKVISLEDRGGFKVIEAIR